AKRTRPTRRSKGPALRSARRKRPEVRRNRDDVLFRQLRDRLLHQRGVGAGARAVLHGDQLPRDVDGLQPRDARHLAETRERVAVADGALDRLAGSSGLDERLPLRDAAGRHVRGEPRVRIANRRAHRVVGNLDDAAADRLGPTLRHDAAMPYVFGGVAVSTTLTKGIGLTAAKYSAACRTSSSGTARAMGPMRASSFRAPLLK